MMFSVCMGVYACVGECVKEGRRNLCRDMAGGTPRPTYIVHMCMRMQLHMGMYFLELGSYQPSAHDLV